MAQRRRPSNNPCGQLCFVIPLLLLLSSAGTYYVAASSTFYSSRCPSPVPAPDRHTDDHAELLKPFHLPTGFFSGNGSEILFSPDIGGMFGRTFSFVPQNLSRTADPVLLHLAGTLKLSGQREVTYEKDGEVRGWHRYKVAISFNLDGYYSTTTSQLCMVGTGTEATSDDTPDGPVKHYADVAVHLRVPSRPSLTDPFVTGSLDGAEFETISLFAYAEGNGVYEYSGRASCPPQAAMPTTARRHVLQPQHGGFSCAALRAHLIFNYRVKQHARNSSLPQLHEPRMIVNQVRCDANGAVRLYAVFSNETDLWSPPTNRFLVEKQAVVADGFWELETSRLCLHACRVVRSASGPHLEVRECGIGMSFWFPAVWTVRDRSATDVMLWNARASQTAASGDHHGEASVIISNPITASVFQKIVRSNLSDVSYHYNQTMLETAKRHYRLNLDVGLSNKDNKKKTKVSFPGNYTYRDFEFMFFADDSVGSGSAYPVSIGSAMVDGDRVAAEYSFSQHAAAEMERSRLVNVSYGILYEIVPTTDWASRINQSHWHPVPFEHQSIRAEGVYDTKTGFLSMVGCREFNGSTDCQVLITVQFTSFEAEQQGFGCGTGRISSLREANTDDELYFEARNITLLGTNSQKTSWWIWRMDRQQMFTLASSTLSCAFTVLQILHTKRNRNRDDDAAPAATSMTMLVVLALGHAAPLALHLRAQLENRAKHIVWMSSNGLHELHELFLRAPALIALVLQLRLLQLAWSGRRRSSDHDHRWSIAEWRLVRVLLPLYVTGTAVTVVVHEVSSRAARGDPMFVHFGGGPGATWDSLASYVGLVADGFLLPQVALNAIAGSSSSAKAISPWFYGGITVILVAPHLYGAPSLATMPWFRYAASPHNALFGSVAWDFVATCGAVALAMMLFLQQRFGGDFFLHRRTRSRGYEMVSTFRS